MKSYNLTVTVSDGSLSDTAAVAVNVTDVAEPVFGTANGESITGTAGKDLIDALGGNDIINGLGGDDHLTGGTGLDRFVYDRKPSGKDVISDFDPSLGEVIQFGKNVVPGVKTFAKLTGRITDSGPDAIIDIDGVNTITLLGVNEAELTTANFQFL